LGAFVFLTQRTTEQQERERLGPMKRAWPSTGKLLFQKTISYRYNNYIYI
jgi:hypothetical protein